MYRINSNDTAGSLISQLKVIEDDLAHLRVRGEKPCLSDYPFLTRTVNEALLTTGCEWNTANLDRVERCGFFVTRNGENIQLFTKNGYLTVPVRKVERKVSEDWREALVD